MTADVTKPPPSKTTLLPLAAAGGVGVVAGGLTSYGQALLPDALDSMANSAGSWSLIAFLLGTLSPRPWVSTVIGALSLAAMVVGYDVVSVLRGFAVSSTTTAFWLTAAVVVGPVLGWGANAVRRRTTLAPCAVGAMSGVLVGEGVYGLIYIADTTSPAYWSGSVVAGVTLLVWACVRRFSGARSVLLAAGTTALTATAFVALSSSDLFSWFSGLG